MKPLKFILLFITFLGTVAADAKSYELYPRPVVQLMVRSSSQKIQCTATPVLYGGKGYLVTNAHCIANGAQLMVNDLSGYFSSDAAFTGPHEVKLIKMNGKQDLALLSNPWPESVIFFNCLDQATSPGSLVAYTNKGFVNDKEVKTSGHGVEGGISNLRKIQMNPSDPNSEFYEVDHLEMISGMSGGLAIDNEGLPAGILAKLYPNQNFTLILPFQVVQKFITTASPESSDPITAPNSLQPVGPFMIDVASNTYVDGGNSTETQPPAPSSPLLQFSEALEGVLAPDQKTVILSINGKQVDGQNDFLQLRAGGYKSSVTRAVDGYPPQNEMLGLLKRLDGYYYDELFDGKVHRSESYNYIYLLNAQAPRGLELGAEGGRFFTLTIDSRKNSIQLDFTEGNYDGAGATPSRNFEIRPETLSWRVQWSADAKRLSLIGLHDSGNMICDNRNEWKLICFGGDQVLSLSWSGLRGRATMRFAEKIEFDNQPAIHSSFSNDLLRRER